MCLMYRSSWSHSIRRQEWMQLQERVYAARDWWDVQFLCCWRMCFMWKNRRRMFGMWSTSRVGWVQAVCDARKRMISEARLLSIIICLWIWIFLLGYYYELLYKILNFVSSFFWERKMREPQFELRKNKIQKIKRK